MSSTAENNVKSLLEKGSGYSSSSVQKFDSFIRSGSSSTSKPIDPTGFINLARIESAKFNEVGLSKPTSKDSSDTIGEHDFLSKANLNDSTGFDFKIAPAPHDDDAFKFKDPISTISKLYNKYFGDSISEPTSKDSNDNSDTKSEIFGIKK